MKGKHQGDLESFMKSTTGLGQYISFLLYREVQVAMQMSHSWEESLSLVMHSCFNLCFCYQYQDTRDSHVNIFFISLTYT